MNHTEKHPFFSIITPTYNRAWCIEERVIKSVLNQDFKDFELIIVDDGSTDNTPEIFKKYKNEQKIIYYRIAKRSGAKAARNIGIDMSKGEWLIFLDSDDELLDGALDLIKKEIDKTKGSEISLLKFNAIEDTGDTAAKLPFEEAIINFDDYYFWDFAVKEFYLGLDHLNCVESNIIKTNEIKFSAYINSEVSLEGEFYVRLLKFTPMKIINKPLAKFNRKGLDRTPFQTNILKFKNLSLSMDSIIKTLELYEPKKEFIKPFKEKVLYNGYLRLAYFNVLCGNRKEVIRNLRKSLSYGSFNIKHAIIFIGYCLPFIIVKFLYYTVKKIHR